ncbi:chlorophyll synthase ChlG [Belnapia sp. T18]|uniref:Chlorophyll synthase ChlG n=1 Tax=Belnapia arida TaxID=2804533 RepID=A0ABS1U395_9PROT|nr:chlorophyll synthase ChlG [Belnapia arida]MBL6079133.1 chlorophyll synthase ChlG [Belnapia arida]
MSDRALRFDPAACLELLKPITWFAPMWAFSCGVVSSGVGGAGRWHVIAAGLLLTGPLVCGTSQAINDWFDRHVDAINEPGRPIPSGRIPGRWGLYIAILWTLVSLAVATVLGVWGFAATVLGLALAWAYSAPPLRLKANGWWGNAACGACYEGLPWITGAAVLGAAAPDGRVLAIAALYSIGAHGIMTLNDFKSVEGDARMGVGSLPVKLGVEPAAQLACVVMAVPQVVVVALLLSWGSAWQAGAIGLLLAVQLWLMQKLLADPRGKAPWYNGTGTTLYVLGMLFAAFAIRSPLGPVLP